MPYPKYWTNEKLNQLKLLYDSGLSMKEVGEQIGKSIWAINSVMKRNRLNRRQANQTRTIQFNKSPLSFNPKIKLSLSEKQLKVAGLMLYWGEGAKKNKNGQINLANADPQIISVFIAFLRRIYKIQESKLRCHLYCFDTQNIQEEVNYWSELTQIPQHQFIRPYITTNKNPSHAKISHGVCHIVYSDKRLFNLMLSEIHKLVDNLNC
ncbi:MAG: GcrA family cell cycle regulator [bacterium]